MTASRGVRGLSVEVLAALLVVVVAVRGPIGRAIPAGAPQAWMTVFVSMMTQATPFLVFGVVLSGVVAVFVPARLVARALPRRPAVAVPLACAAGALVPGCECASVPVAGALVRRGVTPAPALAFLLASPAVNPVVLTSTAVAFPGRPGMVVARAVSGLVAASAMGWLWQASGAPTGSACRRVPTSTQAPDVGRPSGHRYATTCCTPVGSW